jgi:hypothetical protein
MILHNYLEVPYIPITEHFWRTSLQELLFLPVPKWWLYYRGDTEVKTSFLKGPASVIIASHRCFREQTKAQATY